MQYKKPEYCAMIEVLAPGDFRQKVPGDFRHFAPEEFSQF